MKLVGMLSSVRTGKGGSCVIGPSREGGGRGGMA